MPGRGWSSPIVWGDHVFITAAVNATDTAEPLKPVPTYNGRIFAMSEDGDTYVIQAGPEFKVLGKNSLNEMTLATPAVSNGSLIVRTASKLYRIAGKP